MTPKAVVVLSGGQDSTTCLFAAKQAGFELHAITFDYGQRHSAELRAAKIVGRMAGVVTHRFVQLGDGGNMEMAPRGGAMVHLGDGDGVLQGTSPLVNPNAELEQYESHEVLPGGLEKTFVPMRNQLFLTIAANRAYVLGTNVLYTGVCQEDFGGYPDCRRVFIDALEHASSLGTFTGEPDTLEPLRIETPLMNMTKADSVKFALTLEGCYEALAYSHTSYDGKYPPTGHDHATLLRAKGFEEARIPDPLILRAWIEGSIYHLPDTVNYIRNTIFEAAYIKVCNAIDKGRELVLD